jgi:hypothetical protein
MEVPGIARVPDQAECIGQAGISLRTLGNDLGNARGEHHRTQRDDDGRVLLAGR